MIDERHLNGTTGKSESYTITNNGTFTVKGEPKMRLIDGKDLADTLLGEIFDRGQESARYEDMLEIGAITYREMEWMDGFDEGLNHVYRMIDNAPTIDAVPVKHGRWIYKGVRGRFPVCECSVCGNAENADWAVLGNNVNYCPNCGAKMDKE